MANTIIIGIDPGSRKTGYGVICQRGDKLQFIDAGVIATTRPEMPVRLQQIFTALNQLIIGYKHAHNMPIESAIEQVFMGKNPNSALKLGQARGCAITALVANDLTVAEYSARQIKQAVCGTGSADKVQVQKMITRLLNLDTIPQEDASDALACAICHANSSRSMNKLLASVEDSLDGTAKKRPTLSAKKTTRKKGRWRLTEEALLKR